MLCVGVVDGDCVCVVVGVGYFDVIDCMSV